MFGLPSWSLLLFPLNAKELDCFYLRPWKGFKSDMLWHDCAPVGKETLKNYMASLCAAAGIERKSNHSFRATRISAMLHAGVPKKTNLTNSWCYGESLWSTLLVWVPHTPTETESINHLSTRNKSFDDKENTEPPQSSSSIHQSSLTNKPAYGSCPAVRSSGPSLG